MTPAEIQTHFSRAVIFADDEYARPSLAWLQGKFWDAFQRDRWDRVGSYSRKNDCDNWARAYAQLAQDCHAATVGNNAAALAVGEFFYAREDGVRHAIVCAFVESGLVFIEPQNGRVLTLTPSERQLCFFVRF